MRILLFLMLFMATDTLFAQHPILDSLSKQVVTAQKKGDRYAEAQNLLLLAREQADNGKAREALDNALAAVRLFESLGKTAEVYKAYIPLLAIHQQLHNADKIIEYALPGIAYAKAHRDTTLWTIMLSALGIGYDEKGQYDQSIECYLSCIRLDEAAGRPATTGYSNASSTFSFMGRYEEAARYAKTAIERGTACRDTADMTMAWLCYSYAVTHLGRTEEADYAANQAEALAQKLDHVNLDRDLSLLRALNAAARNDFRQAYQFHLKYHTLDSSMASEARNAQFSELEAVYQTQKKAAENARLDARVQQQQGWLWSSFIAILLLTFAFWQQIRRRRADARLVSAEQQLIEVERRRLEEEKAFHLASLAEMTRLLIEKNTAIEALCTELEMAKQDKALRDQATEIEGMSRISILTEEDWRLFRQKFERVYPNFFFKLGQSVPDATEAEQRLAALTKLDLANTEIASILGISPESVTKSRYRLNKKIESGDLRQLVRVI